MNITIGDYIFEGPYNSLVELEDRSGVYAIICEVDDEMTLIDVGESSQVKSRIESHDRDQCWKSNCGGRIGVAVLYTPSTQQAGRMLIEHKIRAQYKPPCGER